MNDDRQGLFSATGEAELFDAICFGDDEEVRDAVEELVRRYGSRLLDLLGRWGFTRAERDDVANETWLRAWQKIRRFEYKAAGKFFAWLKRIAYYVKLETFRKRYATPKQDEPPAELQDDEALDSNANDGLVLLLRRDFRAAVEATLVHAPENYRALITEHFLNGTELPEIQRQHGWTRSNLDVIKFRALAWLKRRLSDEYSDRFVQNWLA